MKTNVELRRTARQILKGPWCWRLIGVGILLNVIVQGVTLLLGRVYANLGIMTVYEFLEKKTQHLAQGLDWSLPNAEAYQRMLGATAFQTFLAYIFGAILAYGFAAAVLKATRDDRTRLIAASFDGFRRPLELAWLMFVLNLRVFLWSLLLIIPGIVAAYRYRNAWYFKVQHPEWTASTCLSASAQQMNGFKMQAFCLDCGYLGWIFLAVILAVAGGTIGTIGHGTGNVVWLVVCDLIGLGALYFFAYVLVYFFLGRGLFFRALEENGATVPETVDPGFTAASQPAKGQDT